MRRGCGALARVGAVIPKQPRRVVVGRRPRRGGPVIDESIPGDDEEFARHCSMRAPGRPRFLIVVDEPIVIEAADFERAALEREIAAHRHVDEAVADRERAADQARVLNVGVEGAALDQVPVLAAHDQAAGDGELVITIDVNLVVGADPVAIAREVVIDQSQASMCHWCRRCPLLVWPILTGEQVRRGAVVGEEAYLAAVRKPLFLTVTTLLGIRKTVRIEHAVVDAETDTGRIVGGTAGIAGEDEAVHHHVAADEGQLSLIDAAGAGTVGVAADRLECDRGHSACRYSRTRPRCWG